MYVRNNSEYFIDVLGGMKMVDKNDAILNNNQFIALIILKESGFDKNVIDKLLSSLDEADLEPRMDIEFKDKNNETLLSQVMNLNQKVKVKSMSDYLDKKITVTQFFWNDMSTVRLSDFKSAYKSVLDIY